MSEAFLVAGTRTPIGRFGGALSMVRPDDMAAHAIASLISHQPKGVAEAIDDVVLGCANQAGEDNRNIARFAGLLGGLPESVPGVTINRLCGSGLDALAYAARAIKAGEAELMIAGGVESMSRAPFVMAKATRAFSRAAEIFDTTMGWRFINKEFEARFGAETMPVTAENVAAEFEITRADQDAFALRSQQRALAAQASGRLAKEISPIDVPQAKGKTALVENDEHPRETSLEMLAGLAAPFREGGSVTAGNASGVNDGSAALLVASQSALERHGLAPLARIAGCATAGVPPRIMGIGPVPASQRLMARFDWKISDFDVIELNEAFAAQALACLRQLDLPDDADHVNPNGGAIALGHPLGMSGARLALTAATEMKERGGKRALATMCIGVGQGIAMALEAP